jgi:mono/diheme cytochrome c family protein
MAAIQEQSSLFAPLAALAFWVIATEGALADGTGWFTSDQVGQGRWAYAQKCATCHGAQLQGTGAPALKGRSFNAQWNGKSLHEFYDYVHQQMPLGQAGSLKGQEYADIVALPRTGSSTRWTRRPARRCGSARSPTGPSVRGWAPRPSCGTASCISPRPAETGASAAA